MKISKKVLVIALVAVIAIGGYCYTNCDAEAEATVEAVEVVETAEAAVPSHSCAKKCSEECTVVECAECAAKTAECKVKCDAKHAAEKAGEVVEVVEEVK